MKRFFELIDSCVENICKALLLASTVIVSIVVTGRFIFNHTPAWGEQSSLVCIVWLGLLCSTIAVKEGTHLNIVVAESFLPKKVLKILDAVNAVLMAGFALFMIVEGFNLTVLASGNIITGLNIKSSWLFAAVPFTGLILLFQLLRKIRKSKDAE